MTYRYSIGYLPTTDALIYRCIDGPMVIVSLFAANTETSAARQVTIQHVPADETPDDQFSITHNANVAGKGSLQISQPIILQSGDSIYGRASVVDKIVVTLYIIPYGDYVARIS
mgnify:CR=1 FL=1|tara:strand:- start:364 stop:705 length:342 start_codon:yes stop_codon:yes gene_type:complete